MFGIGSTAFLRYALILGEMLLMKTSRAGPVASQMWTWIHLKLSLPMYRPTESSGFGQRSSALRKIAAKLCRRDEGSVLRRDAKVSDFILIVYVVQWSASEALTETRGGHEIGNGRNRRENRGPNMRAFFHKAPCRSLQQSWCGSWQMVG